MSRIQSDLNYLNNAQGESALARFAGHRNMSGFVRGTLDASSGLAIGTHELGLTIPADSVVLRAFYKVFTTFTSATDAATIALQATGANDLVSAVAISNGGNPWDDGSLVACTPDGTTSNDINVTAESEVSAVVAVEALTAGLLCVWLEVLYHGDVAS